MSLAPIMLYKLYEKKTQQGSCPSKSLIKCYERQHFGSKGESICWGRKKQASSRQKGEEKGAVIAVTEACTVRHILMLKRYPELLEPWFQK